LYFRTVLNDVILKEIRENKPDAVIPVDFYGFNFRVARTAKENGCAVFYYVSPQFWASRPGRAERLRRFVDLFLCLFPFEVDFFKKRSLPAEFVGHPILDALPTVSAAAPPARVESVIGLLPGSRPEEIRRHLPVMLAACDRVSAQFPGTRYVLFTVPHVDRSFYQELIAASGKRENRCLIELIQDEGFRWRSQLDLAMTASGMETLENAFLGVPMVIMYKTDWVTYLIARSIINIKYLGMPNLLSDTPVVPEVIQHAATPAYVAEPILRWLRNPAERLDVRRRLLALRDKFGGMGASDRAAKAILEKVA
jgi:lipid-A-disaccharide synthase